MPSIIIQNAMQLIYAAHVAKKPSKRSALAAKDKRLAWMGNYLWNIYSLKTRLMSVCLLFTNGLYIREGKKLDRD